MAFNIQVSLFTLTLPNSHTLASLSANSLSLRAPYTLEVTIALCQAVQSIVTLAHGAYKAAQSICVVLARVAAVLVDVGNRDLHRCVVLGLDDAVGGAALAGDVAIQLIRGLVLLCSSS